MGFCLGAYLAGTGPGYGLTPSGTTVGSDITRRGAQVTDDEDTVIQVDWTFSNGSLEKNKWLYFQEGAYIEVFDSCEGEVLARYSKTGDVAASVTRYGQG